MIGVGAILVRAGLTGAAPTDTIRELLTGHLSPLPAGAAPSDQGVATGGAGAGASGLVGAVQAFKGDKYSQLKRWQDGYSDCSSFVGKGFKSMGVTPPGGSTTLDYAAWGKLKSIPRASVQAGDLLLKPGVHIAIATSNSTAIGQQNSRSNVKESTISDIMFGASPFICLRYQG